MRLDLENMTPMKDKIFVKDLEQGFQKHGNIIIPDDELTDRKTRDRWAQVVKIGKDVTEVKEGEWVLVEKARWTNGMEVYIDNKKTKFWMIDPNAILLVSDEMPKNIQTVVLK